MMGQGGLGERGPPIGSPGSAAVTLSEHLLPAPDRAGSVLDERVFQFATAGSVVTSKLPLAALRWLAGLQWCPMVTQRAST
jgi:hypothetical protein